MKAAGIDGELQLIIFDKQTVNSGNSGTQEVVSNTANQPPNGHGAGHGTTQAAAGFPYVPVIVMALIALIAVWLFAKRKREIV